MSCVASAVFAVVLLSGVMVTTGMPCVSVTGVDAFTTSRGDKLSEFFCTASFFSFLGDRKLFGTGPWLSSLRGLAGIEVSEL